MARFGRGVVQGLLNPGFTEGLFDIGKQIGGAGTTIREKKEERRKEQELLDLDNQLIDIQTTSAELARKGDVAGLEAQATDLVEQLKAEKDEGKRNILKGVYAKVTGNLATARSAQDTRQAQDRMLDVTGQTLAGDLSYQDGNIAGVVAARNEVMKRLREETNEEVRSKLLTALDGLNTQMQGIDAKKAERNVVDLVKAERLYEQLESKGSAITENEKKVMQGVKQRIDQLRQDPETVLKVKKQRSDIRLKDLQQQNSVQSALEKQAVAILSSLDPESDRYKSERQKAMDNNLGVAVKKVEKAAQETKKAKLEYEKLLDERSPNPLTKEQRALGEKYGAKFQPGTGREAVLANREILKSVLKQVSDMGVELALRDQKPLDDPNARAFVSNLLYDLKEEGDLSFAKDIFLTDLEDELRDLSEEDQEYLINSAMGKTPEEAKQAVYDFVQRKFPKAFEATQTEKAAEAEYQQSLQDAMKATFEKYPQLDPNDPVDQAKVMEAANKQLRQAMGVPTAGEVFFGEAQRYDQGRGMR